MEKYIYIIIIIILLAIYFKKQNNLKTKENFTDNIYSHVIIHNEKPKEDKEKNLEDVSIKYTTKPEFLPHKIFDYYYCGKLKSSNLFKNNKEIFLYGKPLEAVHNLYGYYVVETFDNNIINKYPLVPQEKVNLGGPMFLRNGPHKEGPYILL